MLTGGAGSADSLQALVVVGHPDLVSFNHALAHAVRQAWAEAGYQVIFHDLHAEGFDPVLTLDEARGRPTTDKFVNQHIADLLSSDLLAVVHPNCWGAPPAMVKGQIDRVFALNAAYTFSKGEDLGDQPIGLLPLRGALILNTGNTPLQREVEHFGDPLEQIWRQCLLSYCGVRTINRQLHGAVAGSSEADRGTWLADAVQRAMRLASPSLSHASG